MGIESKVRDFMLQNYLFSDDQSLLNNEESFLEIGIIDSTGVLELVLFLESEFGIKVEAEEMVPENLDSVINVVRFVESKT